MARSAPRTAKKIRLELRTDATSVKVAAPGKVVSSSGRDHVFELADARDFAFAASPNFRRVTGSAGGVSIKVYTTSGSGSTALSLAKAAITKFESVYGQYQWPTYVLAQAPRPASGNEFPGIVFLGKTLLSNREVVAHETAHQWCTGWSATTRSTLRGWTKGSRSSARATSSGTSCRTTRRCR
ncbi:MAG: hypothetical protein ACSLFN_01620 [Candidatus Limnocylindrales bacterium]